MKKKLLALFALITTCSLAAFTACAPDDDAVITGNYKKPTQAELDAALSSLDADKLFGDEGVGLSLKGSLDMTTAQGEYEMSENYTLGYTLNADASSVAGMGNLTGTQTADNESETTLSFTMFNDLNYVYVDLDSDYASMKGKVSYEALWEAISDRLPSTSLPMPAIPAATLPESNFSIQSMAEAGIDVLLDTSDGVKLKLTANDTFFDNVLSDVPISLSLTDKIFEIYFYVNQDGLFEQLSMKFDINVQQNNTSTPVKASIEGSLIIKRTSESVQLPDDLTDENKYPVIYEPTPPDEEPDDSFPLPDEEPDDNLPIPDEEPDYSSNAPVDSSDGVIRAVNFGEQDFIDVVYDEKTDTIITCRKNSYSVYDGETGEEIFTQQTLLNIYSVDAYNGKAVFGLGESRQILVVDIASKESKTIVVPIMAHRVAAMEDYIVYCDIDQWCSVARCDYDGNNIITLISSVYTPYLTPNRDDNYVYVTESGLSSCDIYYINLNTNKSWAITQFSDFTYLSDPAVYDGMYLHCGGRAFNRVTGLQISGSDLCEVYPSYTQTPKATLYISEKYSIVRSTCNGLLVYDRSADQFIYSDDFGPEEVFEREDGSFLIICAKESYAAIVDPSKI